MKDAIKNVMKDVFLPSTTKVLLAMMILFASAAHAQGLSKQHVGALHGSMEAYFKDQELVGLQAAVFDGKRVHSLNLGYADMEHQVPVTDQTRFEVASVTKAFTGLALLMLAEKGGIDPHKTVQAYVPSFPEKPEGTITPHLLAGTLAGIRHYEEGERTPEYYATHYDDVAEALELFAADPLVNAPGEAEHYSSYGYNLLAAAIQAASGKRFQDYVQQTILDPLQLSNTGFIDVRIPMKNRSRHYSWIEPYSREKLDHLRILPTWEHSYNMGGGNMYSTAEDLARFGRQFLEPGFLSDEVFAAVYEPHYKADGTPTGFSDGWSLQGLIQEPRSIGTAGSYPGVLALLIVFPEQNAVIAMTTNTWGKDGSDPTLPLIMRWAGIVAGESAVK